MIDTRLKEYPKLTAVRLFKEVRAAGYPGSYNQVKRYVRKVRPRPPEEPVVRFETAPGRQGQVDFAHFRLPWGKRYALIVVLGYSRLLWVQFYTRQTMKALMHGLESSFSYFGGVPSELLFDQMKAVVIEDGRYDDGALVENPEFMRYAYHWNFRIRACRPYRAQTKGKVERPIRYLRESFFYGRTFTSDDDLNAQALHWLETEANVRSHGTLKERPSIASSVNDCSSSPWRLARITPSSCLRDRSSPGTTSLPAIHVERRPSRPMPRSREGTDEGCRSLSP